MKPKHILLIGAGTTLEIYDSYILGFMLSTINLIFFPEQAHSQLSSIVTFSVLFLDPGFANAPQDDRNTDLRIWCPGPESNRHGSFPPKDFKSFASTYFATRAEW
ncbi:MAG: hypothetical protein K0Q57_1113, partial [Gammaproteobacteria bacterium]|nr:hypothetical protein [Gammaproteobacteria bacterium]